MNSQKTFRQSKSLALTLTVAVVLWVLSTEVIHATTAPDGPGAASLKTSENLHSRKGFA